MHSHDRTLVASLGFRDPDKSEPLHDLACAYVSQTEIAAVLAGPQVEKARRTYVISKEVPILKGHGAYQTTIGFLDLLVERYYVHSGLDIRTGVEVKIQRVPVGDLLRQMKLYARHTGWGFSIDDVSRWVVVLRYDIDDAYRSALEAEGIVPIRLGKSFDDWLAKRKTAPVRLRQI